MKAILVVDMPENCSDCLCEQNGICLVKSDAVESIDRPSWCPLKPMPNRIEVRGKWISEEYQNGWNACLKVINAKPE